MVGAIGVTVRLFRVEKVDYKFSLRRATVDVESVLMDRYHRPNQLFVVSIEIGTTDVVGGSAPDPVDDEKVNINNGELDCTGYKSTTGGGTKKRRLDYGRSASTINVVEGEYGDGRQRWLEYDGQERGIQMEAGSIIRGGCI